MVSCFISRLVILIFGTLYPAYASYKAVRTKNVREYVKWMMYWIVFALFTCAETFTDLFLSFWFPFYYEIKIITVIYLLSPATKGSSILYRKFVHPVLTRREQEIDEYIAKAKEQGYHTMLNLGSKGVTYATSLIMQTAIKGGGGLVNHLRRSYSLSDLDEEQNLKRINKGCADDVDSSYDENPRLIRRQPVYSPRQTLPCASQPGLYFSEDDYFRQIPSSEEISCGYSSGDPMYYGMQHNKGDHLVRTTSLGPSSRVRTRAATKNGLPKRGSLAEGGSSWTALESRESQNETDIRFSFPLSHSASCPFPYASFQHVVFPQYQPMLNNVTQNQMFTFINNSENSLPTSNRPVDYVSNFDKVVKSDKSFNSVLPERNIYNDSKGKTLEDFSKEKVSEVFNFGSKGETKINEEMAVVNMTQENREEENEDAGKIKMCISKDEIENKKDISVAEEQPFQERSGKYNKKPAPKSPAKDFCSTVASVASVLTAEDEEAEFFTPNSSPKLKRKYSLNIDLTSEKTDVDFKVETGEPLEGDSSVTAKISKSKLKKGDVGFQKKLRMPKMTFSFWHQKSGKQTSTSENLSMSNCEIPAKKINNKENSEYFIPLKGSDSENN